MYWNEQVKAKVFDDVIPTLDYLKNRGYLLGIITDTDGAPSIKKWRIRQSNLTKYFSVIFIAGEDSEKVKPDPEPFILAASKLGLHPEECMMIGDKPFTDIEGAKRAGMKATLVLRKEWNYYANADYVIRSLVEVSSFL
jgi:putative hydrolase of the HAD superfamily